MNQNGPNQGVAPLAIAPIDVSMRELEQSGAQPNPPERPREGMSQRPNRTPGPMSYRVPTDGSSYRMVLGWTARSVEVVNSSTQVLVLTNDMGDSISCGAGGVVVVPTLPSLNWTAQLIGGASTNGRSAYVFFFAHYRPTLSGSLAGGSAVTVTNLPPSALLADATANPNTALNGAAMEVFNGATWDRERSVQAQADAAAGVGVPAVGNYLFNGATWDRTREAPAADAQAPLGLAGEGNLFFNGASWDRARTVASMADAASGLGWLAAALGLFNGATFDRMRAINALADAAAGGGVAATGGVLFNGATFDRWRAISGAGAGLGTAAAVAPNGIPSSLGSAANTAVSITLPAVPGQRNRVRTLQGNYNPVTTAVSTLTISDNGTQVWGTFLPTGTGTPPTNYYGENGVVSAAVNTPMVVALGAGGAGVTGIVNVTYWVG